jgi:hypothetical protein
MEFMTTHDLVTHNQISSPPHLALLTEATIEEWMLGVYVDFTTPDAEICYLHPPLQYSVKSSYNELLKRRHAIVKITA